MAFVAVDRNGLEFIYDERPEIYGNMCFQNTENTIQLPSGTIKKLIGCDLSWDDEPVELT